MKQTYKKKPEYLKCVDVLDDTQSIKDVYEMAEVTNANITFDSNLNRVIVLEDGTQIPVGSVLFKEKKSGKLIVMSKEKLLQYYDEYSESSDDPESENEE